MQLNISDKVLERLTLYHCILTDCILHNVEFISSPKIANLLRIDDSQVRKDLALIKYQGNKHNGYAVHELKATIESALRFEQPKDAFIIGAGNLGFALAKYDNFVNYGLNVLALFDNDNLKIDIVVNKKQVFHLTKLPNLVDRLQVKIAILTVPRETAQEVTDLLVSTGIKYIWNFTPAILEVPEDVEVLNENLVGNFLKFTYSHKATKNHDKT